MFLHLDNNSGMLTRFASLSTSWKLPTESGNLVNNVFIDY